MKKFTLLMGAALVAMSANATLYITGDGVPGSNWAPENPMEVELGADGFYTFELTSNQFKISDTYGNWNAFNAGARQIDGAWEVDLDGGTAIAALKLGNGNINKPDDHITGTVTYLVSADLEDIMAEFEPVTVDPNEVLPMYLVGDMNGWNTNDSAYAFESEDGITYTLTAQIEKGKGFKVCGGAWGVREFGGPSNMTNGTYNLGGSGDMTLATGGNVTLTLVQSNNFASATLTVAGQEEGGGDDPEPEFMELWMVGNMTGWGAKDAYKMATTDGITYTLTTEIGEDAAFKFYDGDWNSVNFGMEGETEPANIVTGIDYNVVKGGKNITIVAGTYTFKLVVDAENIAKATLTVTSEGGDDPTRPATMYVLGTVNHGPWAANNGILMVNTESGYEADFKADDDNNDGFGYIAFAEHLGADSEDWAGLGNRWGASSEDEPLVAGEPLPLVQTSQNYSFKVPAGVTLHLSINWDAKTVSLSTETGVAAVAAENGEAIFFNMQGQRVANPENGLFIRVQNGKAVKVVK